MTSDATGRCDARSRRYKRPRMLSAAAAAAATSLACSLHSATGQQSAQKSLTCQYVNEYFWLNNSYLVTATNARPTKTSLIFLFSLSITNVLSRFKHWLQKCPATQQQRLAILGTTDRPLDILTTDRLQLMLYAPETVLP